MGIPENQWVSEDGSLVDRRVFSDEEIYRQEQKKIFNKSWLFLCHDSQIKKPGDFFTSYMGEEPVIVSRHTDGEIYVSINSCRHRGLRVCRADHGNAKSHTCPYHGWTYGPDGELKGMPGRKEYYKDFDRTDWGLIQARVGNYKGLVFGTFNHDGPSLEEFLGDSTFYLDTLLDRSEGGMEVVGGVQKWMVNTNWKMPAENMVGDTYHAMMSHRSVFSLMPDADSAYKQIQEGHNVAMKGGHGTIARHFTEDSDPELWLPGESAMLEMMPEVAEFFRTVQDEAAERLGSAKLRTKPGASTCFPNFSILSSVFCIRIAHPRGPLKSELWNWVILPKAWPDYVKEAIVGNYHMTFGPGGMLEQDDNENWEQVTLGSIGEEITKHPYHFGMGMGDGGPHPDIPGTVGSARNELPQREMYRHWQNQMNQDD